MPLIEILDAPAPILEPDRPARFALEVPRPGQHFEGLIVEVRGWLSTGKEGSRIELRRAGALVWSLEPDLPRPDVCVRYPDENGVGFLGQVSVADWGETRFEIQAAFSSGPPMDLGSIRARRIWREDASRNDTPLVSVVIRSSGGLAESRAAVESVLAQTYPNLEILVVARKLDSASSLLDARFAAVRQVSRKGSGVAAANNLGIRRTVGDFILFLGPGEILLPDALRLGLQTFREHPEAAIVLGHGPRSTECLSKGSIVLFRRSVFESVGVFRFGGRSKANLVARIAEIFPWSCHHEVTSAESASTEESHPSRH